MAILPDDDRVHPIAQGIYDLYETKEAAEERRGYVGASSIGDECERKLWYRFRWVGAEEFDGRMLRLFQRGHREEDWFIEELREMGLTVVDRDPETGEQMRGRWLGGHMSGGMDAVIGKHPLLPAKWCVFESKTMAARPFEKLRDFFRKHGYACRKIKPEHYAQCQTYMKSEGLKYAVYAVACKDNDHIHIEIIEYDDAFADGLIDKAQRIIEAHEPPLRASKDPEGRVCRYCEFNQECHRSQAAETNCRTCVWSTPVIDESRADAPWTCDEHKMEIDNETQRRGCDQHLLIPALIPYGKPIKSEDGYVLYQLRSKVSDIKFANVTADKAVDGAVCFRSEEFHDLPGDLLSITRVLEERQDGLEKKDDDE